MRERLCQRADCTQSLRLREDLWAAVRGDQKKLNLRLEIAKVSDDFKTGDVGEIQIDDAETKTSFPRLSDTVKTVSYEHDFVALRLEHEPQSVAYRRFVVNYENRQFLVPCEVGHTILQDYVKVLLPQMYSHVRHAVQLLYRAS